MTKETIESLLEIRSIRKSMTNPLPFFTIKDWEITSTDRGAEYWRNRSKEMGKPFFIELSLSLNVSIINFILDNPLVVARVCFNNPIPIENLLDLHESSLFYSVKPTLDDFKKFDVHHFSVHKNTTPHNLYGPCDGSIEDGIKFSYRIDGRVTSAKELLRNKEKKEIAQKLKGLG